MARRNSAEPVQRSHRHEGQQGPRDSLESPCAARHAIPRDGIVTGASPRPAKSSVHRTLAGLGETLVRSPGAAALNERDFFSLKGKAPVNCMPLSVTRAARAMALDSGYRFFIESRLKLVARMRASFLNRRIGSFATKRWN
jgi:hypothetical protein